MFGLLYRLRLLVSLGCFFLQLCRGLLYPFRSTIAAFLLLVWFAVMVGLPLATANQKAVAQQQSPLFVLLHDDLSRAGYTTQTISTVDLRAQQQLWELQAVQLPPSRDLLINGALLYFALGDTTRAKILYEAAQHSDPNHPLFSLQLPQFFQ